MKLRLFEVEAVWPHHNHRYDGNYMRIARDYHAFYQELHIINRDGSNRNRKGQVGLFDVSYHSTKRIRKEYNAT